MKNPTLYKKIPAGPWYVRKMIAGVRRAWCTGTTNKKDAQRLGREWFKNLEAGNTEVLRSVERRRQFSTIGEAISAYLGSGLRRCNDETAMDNVRSLRMLIRQGGKLSDEASLDQLTPELVRKFYSIRLAGKKTTDKLRAARTANCIYRTARSIFGKRMLKRGVFTELDVPNETLEQFRECEFEDEGDASYELPDPGIIKRLMLESVNLRREQPSVYIAFLLTLATGIRKGEASWLEFSDIHDEIPCGGLVALIQNKEARLTKSKKSRRVPIHAAVKAELENLSDGGLYVIPGTRSHRTNTVWRRLAAWMKGLGWNREKAAHELRKFYGAQVSTELGLYAAQKYLGHSTPVVTNKYYADLVDLKRPTLALPMIAEVEK